MKARSDFQVLTSIEKKSVRIPFSGCQIWMGSCMANGYGQIGYQGRNEYAHRVAWLLQKGSIPIGSNVLHRCDVRCCINPDHLFLGSQLGNVHDMMIKGRAVMKGAPSGRNPMQLYPRILAGERHGMAKLTEHEVAEIRRRYAAGEKQKALASEFGVNQPHISRIIRNENWK